MKLLSPQKLTTPYFRATLIFWDSLHSIYGMYLSTNKSVFPLSSQDRAPLPAHLNPHKHSVLINLLIYILPLAESLLCWDIKNLGFTMSCGSLDESGVLGENGCMFMYSWVPLLFTWHYHNIVNWIYLRRGKKIKYINSLIQKEIHIRTTQTLRIRKFK